MKNVYCPLIYNNLNAWDTSCCFWPALFPSSTTVSCVYVSSCLQLPRLSDTCCIQAHCFIFRTLLAVIFFFFEIFLLCIPGWPQAHYVAHSHSPVSASRLWDYRGKAPQLTLICYVNYKHFPHWFLGTHVLVFPQKDTIINREPKTASEAVAIPMVVRIRTISKQSCTEHPDNGCLEWAHLGTSIPGSGSHLSPDTVGWNDSSTYPLHLSLISYTERVQGALRRTSHYHTYG